MKRGLLLLTTCCFALMAGVAFASDEYVTGKIKWGMSKAEVIAIEGKPAEEDDLFATYDLASGSLTYEEIILNTKCKIRYVFCKSSDLSAIQYRFYAESGSVYYEIDRALRDRSDNRNETSLGRHVTYTRNDRATNISLWSNPERIRKDTGIGVVLIYETPEWRAKFSEAAQRWRDDQNKKREEERKRETSRF